MRFVIWSVLIFGANKMAIAQISGKVVDQQSRKPLNQANVSLIRDGNSLVLKTGTDGQGIFMFPFPPPGKYQLTISYVGYFSKTIPLKLDSASGKHYLDSIPMVISPLDLAAVQIKGAKPLISIRGDTIQYNAADFQVAEKATLLNLFQKVPGLSIDLNGDFYYEGVPVKELYIDGRPAFQNGTGPKELSRLLLAGIVDKIQVTSKKNPTSLSGTAGREKVINVTIKREMKKRLNGQVGAGYGTDKGYNSALNINRFREKSQVIFGFNASNLSTYNAPSVADESTDLNNRFPGSATDRKYILNAGMDISPKAKINISLSHIDKVNKVSQQEYRENFLADSSFFYNNQSEKRSEMHTNIIGLNFNYQFNERNSLSIRNDLFLTKSGIIDNSVYQTLADNKDSINYGTNFNDFSQENHRSYLVAEFSHQFKKGGAINFSVNFDYERNREEQINASHNVFLITQASDTINQLVKPQLDNLSINVKTQFMKPLGKQFYLQVLYDFRKATIDNRQITLDFDHFEKSYSIENNLFSYRFHNSALTQNLNAGIAFHRGKFNTTVGLAYNSNEFDNTGDSPGFNISQSNSYLAPAVNLTLNFTPLSYIRADFSGSPLMPVSDMLIPVLSTQNQLYIRLGNPDLKAGYSRRFSLDYTYRSKTGLNVTAGANMNFESNSISTDVYTDSIGRQVSKPINVNGTRSFSPTLSLGKRFDKIGLTLNYRSFCDFRNAVSFLNATENFTRSIMVTNDLTVSWMYNKLFELTLNAQINYRGSKYSIQNNSLYGFYDQRTFLKLVGFLPAGIEVAGAAMYIRNSGLNQPYVLLNAWVSKLFGHDKNWLVKCYGFDLLKQNKSQLAYVTPTFSSRMQSNSQGNYFLFSMTRYFK